MGKADVLAYERISFSHLAETFPQLRCELRRFMYLRPP
jgi:hypothetical protein